MSPTLYAMVIQALQLVMSLVISYVVHKWLGGTAFVNRKGLRLGGAAATFFIVFYLLNHYLPGLRAGIAGDAAAQPVMTVTPKGSEEVARVSLQPASQLVTNRDLRRLDRNKFRVDEKLEVAVPIPPGDSWEIVLLEDFKTLSVADIPFLGMSMSMIKTMMGAHLVPALAVRSKKAHTITLDAEAKIGSVPMTFSLFDDENFMRQTLAAQIEMAGKLGLGPPPPPKEVLDQAISVVSREVSPKIKEALKRQLPVKVTLADGVYVLPLGKDVLKFPTMGVIWERSSLLDRALMLANIGGYLHMQSLQNLYVSQERRMASFDGSVRLDNAVVDGSRTNAILNSVGFIVTGEERAVLVQLIYLSTQPIATFRILQEILNSLSFTA